MLIDITSLQLILYAVLIVIGLIFAIILVKALLQDMKATQMLDKYEMDMYMDFSVEDANNEIERFVDLIFSDYIVMNIAVLQIAYISDDLEDSIRRGVGNICEERISPSLINKLSLVYNIDKIYDVLAEKIYLFTTNYVINYNGVKEDKK